MGGAQCGWLFLYDVEMLVQVTEAVDGHVARAVILGFEELPGLDFSGVFEVRPALSDFLQLYLHHRT